MRHVILFFLALSSFSFLDAAVENPWELSGSVTNFPADQGMVGLEMGRVIQSAPESEIAAVVNLRHNMAGSLCAGVGAQWLYQPYSYLITGPSLEMGKVFDEVLPSYGFLRFGVRAAWASEDWSMFWEPSFLLSDASLSGSKTNFIPYRFGLTVKF